MAQDETGGSSVRRLTPAARGIAALGGAGALLLMVGCLVSGNRCGANQVALKGDLTVCECAPGTVPDPRGYGCTPCGANEEVNANKCVCKEGYARRMTGGACEVSMLGATCSMTAPCVDPFPYCATDRGDGYCTTEGCATSADCPETWACVSAAGKSYCSRPPSGRGKHCETSDECAGTEALYCEDVASQTCRVRDCATSQMKCFGEDTCCDIHSLIPSIPSLCLPPEALTNGACPLGAPKVVAP